MRVCDVMGTDIPIVSAETTVRELSDRIANNDPVISKRQGTLIVDADDKLAGIVTRGDLVQALITRPSGDISVLEIGKTDLVVAYPDELLHDAIAKMLKHNIGRLPVVNRDEPNCAVGYIGRADVLNARMRLHEEEETRSQGPVVNTLAAAKLIPMMPQKQGQEDLSR
jgi:chloride channel protein, CIC family